MNTKELISKIPNEVPQQLHKKYESVKRVRILYVICVAIIVITAIIGLVLKLGINYWQKILLLYIAMFIPPMCMERTKKKALNDYYASTVVPSILKSFFDEYTYDHNKGFSINDILKSKLFKKRDFNSFMSEDYLSAVYNGVKFEQSDVNLIQVVSNGKSTRRIPVFIGRWIVAEFNKNFTTDLIVYENSIKTKPNSEGMSKIEMESIDFNEKFDILAQNEHNAYYILTPHFMEKMLTIEKNHSGTFLMSFQENKVSIALFNNNDSFSINTKVPFNFENIVSQSCEDVSLVMELIDELNLTEKVFVA